MRRKIPPEMIKSPELQEWQAQHQASTQGLFSSVWRYAGDDPNVGGVIGDFYLDFDCEEKPDKARKEAVAVVKKLIEDYGIDEADIAIAFSGMKGISLTLDYKALNAESLDCLPLIYKSMVLELAAKLRLKTVDTKIYERRRLWRLLNSLHQKSHLFKVPLTLAELESLSIRKIKELATGPRGPFIKADAQPAQKVEKWFLEHKAKIEAWINERKKAFETDDLKVMMDDPPCIKKRREIGANKGERNSHAFQLAVFYASKGLLRDDIMKACTDFSARCSEPLTESEVESLVNSAINGVKEKRYRTGCTSEALADLCDKANCPFFNPQKDLWVDIGEPMSFSEWKTTIKRNFRQLWTYAEACASTIAVLLIKDTQPLALVLQGAPSGGKTTTLDFFRGFPFSHATDKFTTKSFVSHIAQKSEEELTKIDLLPRIKGKVLITPDLTTLFGAKDDELKETFSLLTRVLDGRGLTTESGVYGSRGYEGDYMFTWIGATTPIPHKVWNLFGNLGARMYFLQIMKKQKSIKDYVADFGRKNYRKRVEECNQASLRFLRGIWRKDRIEWDSAGEEKSIKEKIVLTSIVVTRLRGKVNVVVEEERFGDKAHFSDILIEEPDRCINALYSLARGHALIMGRTRLDACDLQLILDVALSSAPWNRVITFAYLLTKGSATARDIMENLKCSRNKAIRSMKTLELLDLVDLKKTYVNTNGGPQLGYIMTLKEEFNWFRRTEFMKLWRQKPEYPTGKARKQKETRPKTNLDTFESAGTDSNARNPRSSEKRGV